MAEFQDFIIITGIFLIISLAAIQLSRLAPYLRLPVITGLLFAGILSGPYLLGIIPKAAIEGKKLEYINEFSLAFIAFAAGCELYLKELRGRLKSIVWNTFGQLVITFSLGTLSVMLLSDWIPFLREMSFGGKMAVALLAGTIFVARSPSSAIAIINELRAKGPFTQTAMGVTVVKDVLVIILFSICFTLAETLVKGNSFDANFLLLLLLELAVSFGLGFLLGKFLGVILSTRLSGWVKTVLILLSGFGIYKLSHLVQEMSGEYWKEIHLEPLLICIIASFTVTNFSRYRAEFQQLVHEAGPAIYAAFFTLTGASMALDVLADVWLFAVIFFGVRLISMIIASFVGGALAGDPPLYRRIGWMPYVTQAGVGLGLAAYIGNEFGAWGPEFATIMIAVIVLNQVVGPPLFKIAIQLVKESHIKPKPNFDGIRDAIIFGLENQSIALARQLRRHGWQVKIASRKATDYEINNADVEIVRIAAHDIESLRAINTEKAEAVITLLSDDESYKLCELAYEHFGTKDLVVRLNSRENIQRFHELGALIVEPNTAIVSLLDHMVRSPQATSLILGQDENQDTVDVEVNDSDLHGIRLRDLRLPSDVLILSVSRNGNSIISHGYTRIRKGDILTLVGSIDSLNQLSLRFEGE